MSLWTLSRPEVASWTALGSIVGSGERWEMRSTAISTYSSISKHTKTTLGVRTRKGKSKRKIGERNERWIWGLIKRRRVGQVERKREICRVWSKWVLNFGH